MKRFWVAVICVLLMVMVACSPSGETANDSTVDADTDGIKTDDSVSNDSVSDVDIVDVNESTNFSDMDEVEEDLEDFNW